MGKPSGPGALPAGKDCMASVISSGVMPATEKFLLESESQPNARVEVIGAGSKASGKENVYSVV